MPAAFDSALPHSPRRRVLAQPDEAAVPHVAGLLAHAQGSARQPGSRVVACMRQKHPRLVLAAARTAIDDT